MEIARLPRMPLYLVAWPPEIETPTTIEAFLARSGGQTTAGFIKGDETGGSLPKAATPINREPADATYLDCTSTRKARPKCSGCVRV
jgi:hypothetical protein